MEHGNNERTFTQEVLDAHTHEVLTIGIGRCQHCPKHEPVVESQGLDLNEYTLKHILPGAAEMCEEGKQREIALQRDVQPGQRNVLWFVEVAHGVFETTSALPRGMPAMRWQGKASEANWIYVQHLHRYRVARGEAGRKMARETTFMQAGKGVQG